MNDLTFIETQFPIARLSAESYKERKANLGQTLTRLGKWWGRKPLVLVRASILGMLMPASDDPRADHDVFLKLMTMDDDGVWRRRKGTVRDKDLLAEAPEVADDWDAANDDTRDDIRQSIWEWLSAEVRARLEAKRRFPLSREQFDSLPYDQRLKHCVRPEQIDGPDAAAWSVINAHLGTNASTLSGLVNDLGGRRFGHRPRVGDAFCGGGSIPFEAGRIGCDAYGSDLNPVAALLTWASLHLIGGGREVQERVRVAQEEAFAKAEAQMEEWGVEHNEEGWRADAYLYCVEVKPPGCDYRIPLAPNWVVGEKLRAVASLIPASAMVEIAIKNQTDAEEWETVSEGETATVKAGRVVDPFTPDRSWPVEVIRGPQGLRPWDSTDLVPDINDAFSERLYCIRWVKPDGSREYRAPTRNDLQREARVLALLRERWRGWVDAGVLPSAAMPTDGVKTEEPIRTRGWTHWHHLFTPRQLLTNGLLISSMPQASPVEHVASMLAAGRLANWNSRLSRWHTGLVHDKGEDVFSNQALNTLFNFSCRPLKSLNTSWYLFDGRSDAFEITESSDVFCADARDVRQTCDLWITDPPYADAVNYHELADFFLAWIEKQLPISFPGWVADSRRALAVRGTGGDFKKSMVEIYSNLARHMPDNGLQMVQFTHQDPAVWADLGMILWASGLRVTAAWTIATETPTGGVKKGNYVQGTVLLVLRKRLSAEGGFLDEVYPLVEDEVRSQIDSMRALDEGGEPNFGDTDFQLAAYAAALRVLTQYQTLDGQDVGHELFRVNDPAKAGRGRGKRAATTEKSRFEQVIDRGIQIACDYLVPRGLDIVWPALTGDERLYLRALDVESRGERRQGVYQELARGFGVREVKPLLHSATANTTRVRTATEFAKRDLGGDGFAGTRLRQLLFAVYTAVADESPEAGWSYLKETLRDYWGDRQRMTLILDWLAAFAQVDAMQHWTADSHAAKLLAGRLRADHG